jgi:hypothetical protein
MAGALAAGYGLRLKEEVQVHESAVGKNCSELSGFLLLNSSVFLRKTGHARLQLAWSLDLQETQYFVSDFQSLALWFSPQLLHLSCSSRHSLAR